MPKNKLSAAQARVMRWLSQGWSAHISHGSAVTVNGERICNVDTISTLVRLGLIEEADRGCWNATEEGKKLSPQYVQDDA